MNFLKFLESPNPGKLTKRWLIKSTSDDLLGFIQYYAPWRKYTWSMANAGIIFDIACTQEVIEFLKLHKDDRQ
jgi:hypothetical protein